MKAMDHLPLALVTSELHAYNKMQFIFHACTTAAWEANLVKPFHQKLETRTVQLLQML